MALNIDPLMDTFQKYSQNNKVFGASHKKQLDLLKELAQQITERGVFYAEITDDMKSPILKIQHNEKDFGKTYFIDFGYNIASDQATLILSMGAEKTDVSHRKSGFDLGLAADSDEMLTAIGRQLVAASEACDLRQSAIKYSQATSDIQRFVVKKLSMRAF